MTNRLNGRPFLIVKSTAFGSANYIFRKVRLTSVYYNTLTDLQEIMVIGCILTTLWDPDDQQKIGQALLSVNEEKVLATVCLLVHTVFFFIG